MIEEQSKLYFLVLGLMTGVVLIALGGGLFGQAEPWILQWQHQAFSALCHQVPERSFWMAGQPMAVCSRCFGIYTSFLGVWMVLPLISFTNIKRGTFTKKILIAAIIINLTDVVGNMLEFWQNTLISRMVLGALIGSAAAALFSGSFFTTTINKAEEHYGRVTTSNPKQ